MRAGGGAGQSPTEHPPPCSAWSPAAPWWGRIEAASLALVLFALTSTLALAQARHPFAVGATEVGAPGGAFGLWLAAEQARFTHLMTDALRGTRDNPAAVWTLAAVSFAYGVFHAAGPGHGKAVMASYMIANERALSRGLILTGAAALLQALVAIALVAVLRLVFGATAARMTDTAFAIEFASYGLVATLGAWLVWRKGFAFVRALAATARPQPAMAFAGVRAPARSGFVCEAVNADSPHDTGCAHCLGVNPALLGQDFSWSAALGAVAAAGARPCSGAIIVLVFALAQDRFAIGVLAALAMAVGTGLTTGALAIMAVYAKRIALRFVGTDSPRAVLVARGAELLAACAVLAIGAALLLGSAVAQRLA